MKLLLKRGADINATNDYKQTALICAIDNASIDIIELLIEHDADVHAEDLDGDSAFDMSELVQNSYIGHILDIYRDICRDIYRDIYIYI